MPISDDDKREAAKDRATVATGKQLKDTYDLIAALKEQLKGMNAVDDEYKELDKLITSVEKSKLRLIKTLKDEIAELEKEERTINRVIAGHKKVNQEIGKLVSGFKPLMQAYNEYHLQVQEIVSLSGQFTGKFDQGVKSFEKMRTALNLTRTAAAEFGKVWSEVGRRGVDLDKFTKSVEHLQKVFGQTGGIEKAKEFVGMKVAPGDLKKILENRDLSAMIKASGQANVTVGQTRAMSGLVGRPKGPDAEAAVRFQKAEAWATKLKDDLEAKTAQVIQMGIGPEQAGMVVPLLEISQNTAALVEQGKGFFSWVKSAWPAFVGKGAGAAASAAAGAGGTAAGAAGGTAAGAAGTGWAYKTGRFVGKAWRGAKALPGRAATWMGPKAAKIATTGAKGVGVGLGFEVAGEGLKYAAEQIEEDELSSWRMFLRTGLKSLGKASKVAGSTIGAGQMGATAGSLVLPGAGTAVGAVTAGAAGAYTEYQTQYGAGAVAQEEEEKEARDRVRRQKAAAEKKEAQEHEVGEAMEKFKDMADPMAAAFAEASEAIGQTPEVIAHQIAQSRLPQALESIDPGPMQDLANKASTAFQTAADKAGKLRDQQMADLEAGAVEMEKKAAIEKQKDPFSGMEQHYLDIAKNFRTQQERVALTYQESMKQYSLVTTAEQGMQRYETRKGQRGLEVQAATAEYERTAAGVGDVEAMQEIQDKVNIVYEENVADLRDANALAVQKLMEQRNLHQKDINSGKLLGPALETAKDQVRMMDNKLAQQQRNTELAEKQLAQENQQFNIQKSIEKAMAATETITFKKSQRAMALAKAQESFAREGGLGGGEIGRYAGAQAAEAGTQLTSFMDTFQARMGELEKQLNVEGITAPQRMAIEMRIKDLADKRVELETQSLQARIHAATAEERYNQELIGVNKRVADIQRDTAAKMGMSWQVQMRYQSESIQASRADIESTRTEIAQMAEEIRRTPGGDPAKQLQVMQRSADLVQKESDLISSVLGKQRSFLESSIANAFGIGGGTKVNPVINSRLFGEQVQNVTGQRQAAGPGGPETMQQQQARNLRSMMFGGIGGGVPGPGNIPGLPPGVALPALPALGGGPGAPGQPGGQAAGPGGAAGQDISGRIEIVLNDNVLETRVVNIMRRFNQPGGARAFQ